LPFVDLVLVDDGQSRLRRPALIPACLEKARRLERIRDERGLSFLISADGGLNEKNATSAREAGVDVLVAGSAFFNSRDKTATVKALRG
jgi:ribulose-phosphate 3-epimerase